MTDLIGWMSSCVLILTIGKQVHKQWKEDSSAGVSRWLFLGQLTASVGFTVYSVLVRNWVFVVTNSLLLVNAVVGLAIVTHHRRRASRRDAIGRGRDGAPQSGAAASSPAPEESGEASKRASRSAGPS